MKKSMSLLMLVVLTAFLVTGCATVYPIGSFYTELSLPNQAAGNGEISYTKVGKATSKSYLALIATGDSSIATAAKNGDIQKIKFVDYQVKNVLGIIGEYTTIVYGD